MPNFRLAFEARSLICDGFYLTFLCKCAIKKKKDVGMDGSLSHASICICDIPKFGNLISNCDLRCRKKKAN